MDFESSLQDKTSPIAIDFTEERPVLLLAFGGLAHQLGFPMFEFNNLTSGLKSINKIYLRDPNNLWFHRGLPNMGKNIEGIANFLRQYTAHPSTRRVVIFGNSGGGYAALLFGHLLQADEVHAFAPRTFINPVKRLIHNDIPLKRRAHILLRLFFVGQRKYFDLKKVFLSAPNQTGRYHIHFPSQHRVDNTHAARMGSVPGVHLHPYLHGHHNLIKDLKQNGRLSEIIEQAIRLEN